MAAPDNQLSGHQWSLAIFSSREDADRLSEAIRAAGNADRQGAALTIDVLINGNPGLASEMRARLAGPLWWRSGATVNLWSVPQPDKAETWNQYLHRLMPATDLAFFMDGYVTVEPDAFVEIADALRRRPGALAATSMPSTGRSAPALRRQLLAEGGLHGNLYALTGATVQRLRRENFRLPCELYRSDSALGAALAFDLDPARNAWNWDRIAVVPDARYSAPVADPTRLADLATVIRRRWRQAKGQLETNALKAHLAVEKRSPLSWAPTAHALVLRWADAYPGEARSLLWTDPIAWAALARLRRERDEARPFPSMECLGRYARTTTAAPAERLVTER